MALKNFIRPIDLVSVNSNTFDGMYKTLSAKLSQPCSIIRIVNNSDKDITVSYDGGISDHEFIPTKTSIEHGFQTNAQPTNHVALLAKLTPISVKGAVGTGLVFLSGWYQLDNKI